MSINVTTLNVYLLNVILDQKLLGRGKKEKGLLLRLTLVKFVKLVKD